MQNSVTVAMLSLSKDSPMGIKTHLKQVATKLIATESIWASNARYFLYAESVEKNL